METNQYTKPISAYKSPVLGGLEVFVIQNRFSRTKTTDSVEIMRWSHCSTRDPFENIHVCSFCVFNEVWKTLSYILCAVKTARGPKSGKVSHLIFVQESFGARHTAWRRPISRSSGFLKDKESSWNKKIQAFDCSSRPLNQHSSLSLTHGPPGWSVYGSHPSFWPWAHSSYSSFFCLKKVHL